MPPNWWKEALNLGSDRLLFRDHSPPERQDADGSLWASRSAGLVLPGVRLCQTQQRNNRFRLHRVFFISLPSTCLFPVPGLILIKFTFFITVLSGYQKSTEPVFLNVSRINDVTEEEIQRMIEDIAEEITEPDLSKLKRLGIDEIALVKGQ